MEKRSKKVIAWCMLLILCMIPVSQAGVVVQAEEEQTEGSSMPTNTPQSTVEPMVKKPGKPVIKKLKNKSSKKVTVTLSKKISGATGYQVAYATKSSMKGQKKKSFKGTSITIGGLKEKKTYYFRVRAYTKKDGKTVYGDWGKKKSIKIKQTASDTTFTLKVSSDFTLKLPCSWKGNYVVKSSKGKKHGSYVAFYSKKCYKQTKQGWLFSIARYKDDSYQEMPAYELLGKWKGLNYVAVYPTDVQTEQATDAAQKQYYKLNQSVEKVVRSIQH